MCARELISSSMPVFALLDVADKHPSAALEVVVACGFCDTKQSRGSATAKYHMKLIRMHAPCTTILGLGHSNSTTKLGIPLVEHGTSFNPVTPC
jgi:hypothetical protein